MNKFFFLLLANLCVLSLFATHNKAGEIRYHQIGERTIQCTIFTYTDPSSTVADRDSLELNWGDGNFEFVLRVNGNGAGTIINQRNQQNVYIAEHTYSSFGEYTLAIDDRNRNDGIVNINSGNSSIFSFYLFNTFTLDEGVNSSPQSLLPTLASGSVFTPFEYVASAFDGDGDRLLYRLVPPKSSGGLDVDNYQDPTDFGGSTVNQISLNPFTGYLLWDAPETVGQYNIAIEIISFRNGVENGRYIRDMVIEIGNTPLPRPLIDQTDLPSFASIQEVTIGDTIQFSIAATGQNNLVSLEAKSGLFDLSDQPANFELTNLNEIEQSGDFFWIIDESHMREEAYDVVFQVNDDQLTSGYYIVSYIVNDIDTSTPFLPEQSHAIIAYPNPANDFLNIKSEAFELNEYQIFNIHGQSVGFGQLDGNSVNIQSLSTGVYVLLIDQKYSLRFSTGK